MWTDKHSEITLIAVSYHLRDLGANSVAVTMDSECEAIQLSIYLEENGLDTQVMPRVANECYPRESHLVIARIRE